MSHCIAVYSAFSNTELLWFVDRITSFEILRSLAETLTMEWVSIYIDSPYQEFNIAALEVEYGGVPIVLVDAPV